MPLLQAAFVVARQADIRPDLTGLPKPAKGLLIWIAWMSVRLLKQEKHWP
jgi:hypothetical protein